MATNFLWGNVGSAINLLTTELNALGNNNGSAYGPEVGGANSPQLCNLWLHLGSNSLAYTPTSYCQILLVPSTTPAVAAGVYPTYTSGGSFAVAAQNYTAATIWINPTTQSANVVDEVVQNVIVPAGYFKAILINESGFTLPDTLNTLKLYTTPTQY